MDRAAVDHGLTGRDPYRNHVLDLVRTFYPELSPDDDVRNRLGIPKYTLVETPSYPDLLESVRNLSLRDLKLKSPLASYPVILWEPTT